MVGGKRDEIEQLTQYFPTSYDIFAEPFAGGASLLFHLNPPENVKTYIADTHSDLINFYKQLGAGKAGEIKEFLSRQQLTEQGYYNVRDNLTITNDIERAGQFFYLRKTCYRGMLRYNSSGKFNIPWGRYKTVGWSDLDNAAYGQILARTEIIKGDFTEIKYLCDTERAFIFLDPPYDTPFSSYGPAGKFDQSDHHRLFERFSTTEAKCLMVISETPFIRELYNDYIVAEYDKKYRFRLHSNRVTTDNIDKKHLVIKNWHEDQ